MPRATRAASAARESVSSEYESRPLENGMGITGILRGIETLKKRRAKSRSDILLCHEEKLAVIRDRIEDGRRHHSNTSSTLMARRYNRLIDLMEKQRHCEDAIFEQLEAIKKDAEHLAMLISVIYTARMESTKELRAPKHF